MSLRSQFKKTLSVATLLAAASAPAFAADPRPTTTDEALTQLTGAGQAQVTELCIAVTPHFLMPMVRPAPGRPMPKPSFTGLLMNGVSSGSRADGECGYPDASGQCAKGFVKITSTAPLICHAPVAL